MKTMSVNTLLLNFRRPLPLSEVLNFSSMCCPRDSSMTLYGVCGKNLKKKCKIQLEQCKNRVQNKMTYDMNSIPYFLKTNR